MPIRIFSKEAKELTLTEEKTCGKLVTSGSIYSLYVECCSPDTKRKNRVFIAKDGDKIVGWSIIQQLRRPKGTFKFQFMVYIKRSYRRKGLATKMYKRSKKHFDLIDEDIKVYATTNVNVKFFNKVRPKL